MARITKKENNTMNVPAVRDEDIVSKYGPLSIDDFKNKDFASHVFAYQEIFNKAAKTVNKSTWAAAEHLSAIVARNLFKDDFETLDDFAAFMNMSASDLSNKVNAVNFLKEHKEIKKEAVTLRKALILKSADDNGKLAGFLGWMSVNEIQLDKLTDNGARLAWKDYKETLAITTKRKAKTTKKDGAKKEEGAKKEKADNTATAVSNELEGGEKVVTINYGKTTFSVPVKVWQDFVKANTHKARAKK